MKKWTVAEMIEHGGEINYYEGWRVDLKAPKGLSKEEHYEYLVQNKDFLNGLNVSLKRKRNQKL